MKKVIVIILIVIFIVTISYFIGKYSKQQFKEQYPVELTGTIKEMGVSNKGEDYFLLSTEDGDVVVYYYEDTNFVIGQKVKVVHKGFVMDSNPPQVEAKIIEIIEENIE